MRSLTLIGDKLYQGLTRPVLSDFLEMSDFKNFLSNSTVKLTRIESFSAAHRLNSAAILDPLENARIYGKCNNPNGHGHNYKLEVTVEGKVDPFTGMIINMTELKEIIKVKVLDLFDHTHLDLDHPKYFSNLPRYTHRTHT